MRCPHCGTANRAGSNFCNGCGTDLRESQLLSDITGQSASGSTGQQAPANDFDADAQPGTANAPAEPPTSGVPTVATNKAATEKTDTTEKTGTADPAESRPAGSRPLDSRADSHAESADDQPWLRLEFVPDDEASYDVDLDSEAFFDDSGRLVTAVQGLLTPIRIATNITDDTPPTPKPQAATLEALSNDELRMIRGLMSEQPALISYQVRPALRPPLPLRIGWIFALLGVAVGLPALFFLGGPGGTPHRWSGVEDAYLTIQGVASNTLVVVYWAYDPATSGEIDLAMQPVVRHLLQRRARLAVVSTVPGGIASAERLIALVREAQGTDNLPLAADLAQPVTYSYLPGGAASLPILARDPGLALFENIMIVSPEQRADLVPRPALIVAAAATSEDVQQWLEQVHPLVPTPVIAVTAAGADPMLRPYRDSGQLSGLVSGFDGAYAYRQLLDPFVAPETNTTLLHQIILQNWGHFALLALIALGNLAALLSREGGA
jgi:hypothetical protein